MIEIVLLLPFAILLLPVLVYATEVFSACLFFRSKKHSSPNNVRPSLAVLIPAHNEATGIGKTLFSVKPQLQPGDMLLVVADNCTDTTAQEAQAAGATVLSRENKEERGKGYALAYGLDYLRENPPDVVVFIDADCRLGSETLTALATTAVAEQVPVQALNLCVAPAGSSLHHALSGLAFRFKNLIRMQGMTTLGGPCHLTGTGMAIPWNLIESVSFATGNVVEDMQLGIDFTLAGKSPRFVPEGQILSELPTSHAGMLQQRKRWEHGFLMTALQTVPYLLGTAWEKKNWAVFILALDMLVPPLALLAVCLIGAWIVAALLCVCGIATQPLLFASLANVLFISATFAGWFRYCREVVPAQTLLSVPSYLCAKIPLYFEFLYKRQQQWNRAQRS
jgi:glycosyltransferase involved in cell wall biosynthesis